MAVEKSKNYKEHCLGVNEKGVMSSWNAAERGFKWDEHKNPGYVHDPLAFIHEGRLDFVLVTGEAVEKWENFWWLPIASNPWAFSSKFDSLQSYPEKWKVVWRVCSSVFSSLCGLGRSNEVNNARSLALESCKRSVKTDCPCQGPIFKTLGLKIICQTLLRFWLFQEILIWIHVYLLLVAPAGRVAMLGGLQAPTEVEKWN